MAYEFKRLSDVNVIESMSDSTNVLIEENGEIVKMSGNKMIPTGVVKSVNGVTPDEAGNVVMSGLPEGATAYQQLVTDGSGVAKWEDRLAYEHAQTVTWDGDITSPRYTSYSETKGEYRFLDDIPERIEGLKVIGRCVHKATGETRESETVIDSDTHVSTEGDVTYYSYIHATFDFGGELPVSANLELTINESDKEDWPRGVTGGYKVSVLSGETYIIYIESLEFPPTVHKIDPKYLPEGGEPYKQLVTDGEGKTVWEDRLAYSNELLCVPISDTAGYYKVSAKIPDIPNAADGVSANVWMNGAMTSAEIAWKTEESYMVSDYVAVALKDNASLDVGGYMTLSLPEKGTYFVKMGDTFTTGIAPADATAPEIEWDGQTSVVKPIDPKYLPEGVGTIKTVVVTFDESMTTNMSADEIKAYGEAGYNVVLGGLGSYVPLASVTEGDDGNHANFISIGKLEDEYALMLSVTVIGTKVFYTTKRLAYA